MTPDCTRLAKPGTSRSEPGPSYSDGSLELPVTLSRGAYLALQRHGVRNRAQLSSLNETEVADIIGEDLASLLPKARCLATPATVSEHLPA